MSDVSVEIILDKTDSAEEIILDKTDTEVEINLDGFTSTPTSTVPIGPWLFLPYFVTE